MTGRKTKVNEMRETTVRRSLREILGRHAPWVAAMTLPGMALGGPTGEDVIRGAADVQRPDGVTTEIDQFTEQVAIEWQTFDVAGEEFVIFNQPSASSIALNRVVGGAPSTILGTIQANGQVFLINGQGITFGEGAVIDAQGFVASTLDIADDDFMNGDLVFEKGSAAPDAEVRNYGTIQAAADGYVVLAGDYVENSGIIAAQAGHVILGAGSAITLDVEGDGLVNFAVDEATLAELAGVSNAGDILADGSMVIMTAEVANSLVTTAVNQEGLVEARGVAEDDGIIYLAAEGGDIAMSGQLVADGVDGADGGTVVLKAGGDLDFTGSISAAGDEGAEGGFVELSADGGLNIRGEVDTGGGQMLIDPATLTLVGSGTPASSAGAASVGVDFVENALDAGSDVSLIAFNSINASPSVASLTATGTGDLFFGIGSTGEGTTGDLNCSFGVCTPGTTDQFVPFPGGLIDLDGVSISVGGALSFSASYGFLNAGSLAAADDVNINVGGAVIGATTGGFSESATSSGAFGTATGGRDTFGFTGAPIQAGGDVNVSAASSGYGEFAGVFAAGPIDAGGNVTITAQQLGSYGAGVFVLDAFNGSDFAGNTTGGMPVFHSSEQSDGATVTAGGDITITASGSSSAEVITGALDAPSGNIVIGASANAITDGDAAISVIGTQSESDTSWGSGTSPSFIPSNGTFSETVSGGGVSAGGTVSLAATGGTGSYGFAEILTGDISGGASIDLDAEAGEAAEVLAVSTLSESGSFGTPGSGFSVSASGAAIGAGGPLSVSAQAGSAGFGGFVRLGDLELGAGADLDASRDIEIHGAVRGSGPLMASAGSAFWLFPGASIGSSADRFDGEVTIAAGNDAGIHGDIWLGSSGGAPADLAIQTGFGILTVEPLGSDVVVDVLGAASFDGYGVRIKGGFDETVSITADDGDSLTTFDDINITASGTNAAILGGHAVAASGTPSADASVFLSAGDDIVVTGRWGVDVSGGTAYAYAGSGDSGVNHTAMAGVSLQAGDAISLSASSGGVDVRGGNVLASANTAADGSNTLTAGAGVSLSAGGDVSLTGSSGEGNVEIIAGDARAEAYGGVGDVHSVTASASVDIFAGSDFSAGAWGVRIVSGNANFQNADASGAGASVTATGNQGVAISAGSNINIDGSRVEFSDGESGLGSGNRVSAVGDSTATASHVSDNVISLDAGGGITISAADAVDMWVGNDAGQSASVSANSGASASLDINSGLLVTAGGSFALSASFHSAEVADSAGADLQVDAFSGGSATANIDVTTLIDAPAGISFNLGSGSFTRYFGTSAGQDFDAFAYGGGQATANVTVTDQMLTSGDLTISGGGNPLYYYHEIGYRAGRRSNSFSGATAEAIGSDGGVPADASVNINVTSTWDVGGNLTVDLGSSAGTSWVADDAGTSAEIRADDGGQAALAITADRNIQVGGDYIFTAGTHYRFLASSIGQDARVDAGTEASASLTIAADHTVDVGGDISFQIDNLFSDYLASSAAYDADADVTGDNGVAVIDVSAVGTLTAGGNISLSGTNLDWRRYIAEEAGYSADAAISSGAANGTAAVNVSVESGYFAPSGSLSINLGTGSASSELGHSAGSEANVIAYGGSGSATNNIQVTDSLSAGNDITVLGGSWDREVADDAGSYFSAYAGGMSASATGLLNVSTGIIAGGNVNISLSGSLSFDVGSGFANDAAASASADNANGAIIASLDDTLQAGSGALNIAASDVVLNYADDLGSYAAANAYGGSGATATMDVDGNFLVSAATGITVSADGVGSFSTPTGDIEIGLDSDVGYSAGAEVSSGAVNGTATVDVDGVLNVTAGSNISLTAVDDIDIYVESDQGESGHAYAGGLSGSANIAVDALHTMTAGGNITIDAGDSIDIFVEDGAGSYFEALVDSGGSNATATATLNVGLDISAAGNISIAAGGSLEHWLGTDAGYSGGASVQSAGGTATAALDVHNRLTAGGDINVVASDVEFFVDDGFGDSFRAYAGSTSAHSNATVNAVLTGGEYISAGGDINISATGSYGDAFFGVEYDFADFLTAEAHGQNSQAYGEVSGDFLVVAGGDLNVMAADDVEFELSESISSDLEANAYGGSGSANVVSNLNFTISAAGNVGINAGDYLYYEATYEIAEDAQIQATGTNAVGTIATSTTMHLNAGGSIVVSADRLEFEGAESVGAFADISASGTSATASFHASVDQTWNAGGDVDLNLGSFGSIFVSDGVAEFAEGKASAPGASAVLNISDTVGIRAGGNLNVAAQSFHIYVDSDVGRSAEASAINGGSVSLDVDVWNGLWASGSVAMDVSDVLSITAGNLAEGSGSFGADALVFASQGGQANLAVSVFNGISASGAVDISAGFLDLDGGRRHGFNALATGASGNAGLDIQVANAVTAGSDITVTVAEGLGMFGGSQVGGGTTGSIFLGSESFSPQQIAYGGFGAFASGSGGVADLSVSADTGLDAGGNVFVTASGSVSVFGGWQPGAWAEAVSDGSAQAATTMNTGIRAGGDISISAAGVFAEGAAMGGAEAFGFGGVAGAIVDNQTGFMADGAVSVTAASDIGLGGGRGGGALASASGGTADAAVHADAAIMGSSVNLDAAGTVFIVGGVGGGALAPAQVGPGSGAILAFGSGATATGTAIAEVGAASVTISAGSLVVSGAGTGMGTGSPTPAAFSPSAAPFDVQGSGGGSAYANQQAVISGGSVDIATTGNLFVGGGSSTTTGGAGQVDGQGIVSGSTVSMAAGTDLDAALGELHAVNTMDLAAAGTLTMGVINTGDLLTIRTDNLVAGSLFSFSANTGATVQFAGIDTSDAVGFDGSEGGTTADINYVLADLDLFTGVDYLVGGGTNTGGVLVAGGGSFDAGARPITVRSAVSVTGSNAISGTALAFGGGSTGTVGVAVGDGSYTLASAATAAIDATGASSAALTLGGSLVGDVTADFGGDGSLTGSATGDLGIGAAGTLTVTDVTTGGAGSFSGSTVIADGALSAGGGATLIGGQVQLIGSGATYDVATVTTDLVIGGVAAVTVDNTSVTDPTVFSFTDSFGSAALNFGGDATLATGATGTALAVVGSGDLDVSGQSIGMDSLVSFTAVGDILVSEVAIDAPEGAVTMVAGGNIENGGAVGTITAGTLGLIAGDSIILDETILNIGSGTILDFGGDAEVFSVLEDAGVEPTSSSPNATLIAENQIILGDYSMTGDHLYIQTDDLDFDGSVTVPGGTAVQLSPFTEGASFGLEDTLASLQDVNYGNDTHLSGFAGITIVLGNSAHLGDFDAGENGQVDIGDLNLLVATQGEIEGLDSIISTGLVGTLQGGLARVEFFEPTTDEIDPASGSTLDPDQGELEPDEEEDEDDGDTGDDGEAVDGDEEDPPGSVRHRTSDDPGLVCE